MMKILHLGSIRKVEIDPDFEYCNKHNLFLGNQNSKEWTELFIRLREKYVAPQPNPITGLGITFSQVKDAS